GTGVNSGLRSRVDDQQVNTALCHFLCNTLLFASVCANTSLITRELRVMPGYPQPPFRWQQLTVADPNIELSKSRNGASVEKTLPGGGEKCAPAPVTELPGILWSSRRD